MPGVVGIRGELFVAVRTGALLHDVPSLRRRTVDVSRRARKARVVVKIGLGNAMERIGRVGVVLRQADVEVYLSVSCDPILDT